jgi:hypothetical protein
VLEEAAELDKGRACWNMKDFEFYIKGHRKRLQCYKERIIMIRGPHIAST